MVSAFTCLGYHLFGRCEARAGFTEFALMAPNRFTLQKSIEAWMIFFRVIGLTKPLSGVRVGLYIIVMAKLLDISEV